MNPDWKAPRVKSDTETSFLSRNGQRHPFHNLSMETQAPIHLARHSQEVQMNKRANKQPLSRLWARAALTTRSWNCPPKEKLHRSVEERIAVTHIPPFPREPPCCFAWEIPSNYSAFIYFALPSTQPTVKHETCWPPSYSLTLNKFCEIVWRNFEKVVSGAPKLLNTLNTTTLSGMDRVWSAVFASSTPSCAPQTPNLLL